MSERSKHVHCKITLLNEMELPQKEFFSSYDEIVHDLRTLVVLSRVLPNSISFLCLKRIMKRKKKKSPPYAT